MGFDLPGRGGRMADPSQIDGLEQHYDDLRAAVRDRRLAALELPDDHDGRSAALRGLIEATDELLGFTDRLPVLLDQAARAQSVQLVRAGTAATALGAVLVGLGVWRGVLAPWWIAAIVLLLVAAARLATMPIAPAAGAHRRQRYAAVIGGGAALLLLPLVAVFGWWAGLLALAVLGLAQAALLAAEQGWA
jgi:hypothetical protein